MHIKAEICPKFLNTRPESGWTELQRIYIERRLQIFGKPHSKHFTLLRISLDLSLLKRAIRERVSLRSRYELRTGATSLQPCAQTSNVICMK